MNRSQAMAPLAKGEARFGCTVGCAIRGEVRRVGLMNGVDYYEDKGFFKSTIVFRGEINRVYTVQRILKQFFED